MLDFFLDPDTVCSYSTIQVQFFVEFILYSMDLSKMF